MKKILLSLGLLGFFASAHAATYTGKVVGTKVTSGGADLHFYVSNSPSGISQFVVDDADVAYQMLLTLVLHAHSSNADVVIQYNASGSNGNVTSITFN